MFQLSSLVYEIRKRQAPFHMLNQVQHLERSEPDNSKAYAQHLQKSMKTPGKSTKINENRWKQTWTYCFRISKLIPRWFKNHVIKVKGFVTKCVIIDRWFKNSGLRNRAAERTAYAQFQMLNLEFVCFNVWNGGCVFIISYANDNGNWNMFTFGSFLKWRNVFC